MLVDAKPLRDSSLISAITQFDSFDPSTFKTEVGSDFLRYLLATESGDLYMLAFDLEIIRSVTKNG